jgi:hypothetical protein
MQSKISVQDPVDRLSEAARVQFPELVADTFFQKQQVAHCQKAKKEKKRDIQKKFCSALEPVFEEEGIEKKAFIDFLLCKPQSIALLVRRVVARCQRKILQDLIIVIGLLFFWSGFSYFLVVAAKEAGFFLSCCLFLVLEGFIQFRWYARKDQAQCLRRWYQLEEPEHSLVNMLRWYFREEVAKREQENVE